MDTEYMLVPKWALEKAYLACLQAGHENTSKELRACKPALKREFTDEEVALCLKHFYATERSTFAGSDMRDMRRALDSLSLPVVKQPMKVLGWVADGCFFENETEAHDAAKKAAETSNDTKEVRAVVARYRRVVTVERVEEKS